MSEIRSCFGAADFIELDDAALETGSRPAVGLMRYRGEPVELLPGQRLFKFWR